MNLIFCLLGSVGCTLILTLSVITWRVRFYGCRLFRRLGLRLSCPLYCPMCAGFWIGLGMGLLGSSLSNLSDLLVVGYHGFVMACSCSIASFLVWIWLIGRGVSTTPGNDAHRWRVEMSRK